MKTFYDRKHAKYSEESTGNPNVNILKATANEWEIMISVLNWVLCFVAVSKPQGSHRIKFNEAALESSTAVLYESEREILVQISCNS